LKLIFEVAPENLDVVETLRKPSTGLKPAVVDPVDKSERVETLRKPSTGLKPGFGELVYIHLAESRHSENPARD